MSYNPVFSTNNYKIQINILYNTKTAKDDDVTNDDSTSTNDDSLNNNFYIIENMNDILIEEFIKEDNYKYFKDNYKPESDPNPLYIVNDSYYIDANVINTIRKNSTSKFPSYNSTIPIKKLDFQTKHNNFISNKSLSEALKQNYKQVLFNIFKDTFINVITSIRPKRDEPTTRDIINKLGDLKTYDDLFESKIFIEDDTIGNELFHKNIQNIYDNTTDNNQKQALQVFYNISNSNLSYKSKYEYFLKPEIINNIFKIIQENSNIDPYDRRKTPLNNNETKENIYNRYFKYVFPNKKDINNLSDPDKDTILMFYNVYYIIKNIYLLDNTIINITNFRTKNQDTKEKKKYYISQVNLLDLKDNITHFKIEKNKVIIFIKATLKYIIENPILQINYLIDDLENIRQSFLPQSNILLPKDINTNYSSYDKIYIHDRVNYSDNTYEIDSIVGDARKKEYIKNKEELFFNTKALKLFNYFFKRKLNDNSGDSDKIKKKIVEKNIIYLLRKIFKFYNNKEFKKHYIADTYIQYFNNNSPSDKYYSITHGIINKLKLTDKYAVISALFSQLSDSQLSEQHSISSTSSTGEKFYQDIVSSDARLSENKIYKINVVFRCYLNKTGKKPTFLRTLVAEQCLSRAQTLDKAFTDTLYRTFNLPENYLYNKLANITRKQKSNVEPTKKVLENKVLEKKVNPYTQEDVMLDKRGGKIIKKYNHNKNITLKHKTSNNVKFINNNN
jgi:hypothetical protein